MKSSLISRSRRGDGATISGMLVRPKDRHDAFACNFQFTIYARPQDRDLNSLKRTADRGYAGVIFYTRGKYLSTGEITTEHDAIGMLILRLIGSPKQSWCNGIGMLEVASGFTQWAATKHLHPALKTIVPIVCRSSWDGLTDGEQYLHHPKLSGAFTLATTVFSTRTHQ